MDNKIDFFRGMLLVCSIAIASYVLGRYVPIIGAGGFAIFIGMMIATFLGIKKEGSTRLPINAIILFCIF